MSNRPVPFNPLDLLLYAGDEARRSKGLTPADIFIVLECGGRIDEAGLRRAIRALHHAYPVTGAALTTSALTGRPAWRLDADPPDVDQVLGIESSSEDCTATLERLFTQRINWRHGPPLRFYLVNGPADDHVVVRWPHFMMDARGGVILIEELAALYEQRANPDSVISVGDESRRDFGALHAARGLFAQLRWQRGAQGMRPPHWRDLRLCSPTGEGPERIRLGLRRLDPRKTRQVADAAMRVCGFGRFADFVRAAGIRALHESIDAPCEPDAGYSTLHLIDNRKRRDGGPACHNVFSTLPMYIPCRTAGDITAVADFVHEQTRRAWEMNLMQRRLAGLALLTRVPTRVLVARLRRRLVALGHGGLPLGVSNAPSLPLGFMGPLVRPTPNFCGAPLSNIFGVRPPIPSAGYALAVNTAQGRMNLSIVYYAPRITPTQANEFLDLFHTALLGG